MATTCPLSDQARHYLCCYYQILDEMIQGVTTARLGQSISRGFIAQAVPHRRAAIRMCQNILDVSENQAVRRLAQRTLGQCSENIGRLEDVLADCGPALTPPDDLRLYQRRTDLIFREMFAQMRAAPEGNRLDAVFLHQLLPCSRGELYIAQNALRYGVCPELDPILHLRAAQLSGEIGRQEALLGRMGCQRRSSCASGTFLVY